MFFWVFSLFFYFGFVFGLFSGQIKIFRSVYGWIKNFRSTQSDQLGRVNPDKKYLGSKGFNNLFGLPCFC